jgi:segregation and condensation protein A
LRPEDRILVESATVGIEMNRALDFAEDFADRASDDPVLVVDVDGFEGPLDLLLELARRHKLDLAKVSMLALAEQYLAFIDAARRIRLELAADYLVMAAWLAYLKSRLLLPDKPNAEEPSAADLASDLAQRLRRLEALRAAAKQLEARDRLGRDIFARGQPEPTVVVSKPQWQATIYDLLAAYARQRQTRALARVRIEKRFVWSLGEAREMLERIVGRVLDWAPLDSYFVDYLCDPEKRATVKASSFAATLEMVRDGSVELRQEASFAPIFIRRRGAAPVAANDASQTQEATP